MGVKWRELSDGRQVVGGVRGNGTRSLTAQPPRASPGSPAFHFWWPCRGRSYLYSSAIRDFSRKLTFALTISSNPHGSTLVWHGESWPKTVFLFFWDMGRRPTVFYRKGGLISMYRFRLLQVAVLKGGACEAVGDHTSGHLKHCSCSEEVSVTRGSPDLLPGKGGRNILNSLGADRPNVVQQKLR